MINEFINEDGAPAPAPAPGDSSSSNFSGTTSADIKYLPSGFSPIQKRMKAMAQKKHQWDIEVLEETDDYKVNFESEMSVIVPKTHWDQFKKDARLTFKGGKYVLESRNGKIEENRVDLAWTIAEDTPNEIKATLKEAEVTFRNLLLKNNLPLFESELLSWRKLFGALGYFKNDTAILQASKFDSTLNVFKKKVFEEFEDDLGGLQMFIVQLQEGNLNKIKFFDQYKYVLSERVYSKIGKFGFAYEILLDKNFRISESVLTDKSQVLLEASGNKEFAFQNRLILPMKGLFGFRGMKELRILAEEVQEKEDKESNLEE
jgi:hypothetical protein